MQTCRVCHITGKDEEFQRDHKRASGFRPYHLSEYCQKQSGPEQIGPPAPNPNEIEVSEEFESITSIEQFLERIGQPQETLDPEGDSPFFLKDVKFRTWESPTKNGMKQVYYVAANLVRRVPVEIDIPIPASASIQINDIPKLPQKTQQPIYTALIIPDTQIGFVRNGSYLDPFHDRRALSIALQIAESLQPDCIVHLGDILDMPDWTDKFFRSPDMLFTTEPSIWEAAWWFGQFRRTCGDQTDIYAIEGNHDCRMVKAIGNHMPQAWNLRTLHSEYPVLSLPSLLDFESTNVIFRGGYPNGEVWLNENLRCSHGDQYRSKSLDSVKLVLQEARCSEIFGHIHRCEMASKTSWSHRGPSTYLAASPGTLARLDGPIPRYNARVNWQQGLAWVDFEPDNGQFSVDLIHIYEGSSVFRGIKYMGWDCADEVEKGTGLTGLVRP